MSHLLTKKKSLPLVLFVSTLAGVCFLVSGCSTPSGIDRVHAVQDSAKPRSAAYAADNFMIDSGGFHERPFRPWEFYYKNCSLVSRNPYPDRAEYACSEPR